MTVTTAIRVGDVCHVEAIARPRPDAAIGVSLWLPAAGRWSGRYYQMGNGGFAGTIDRDTLAAAAARGDAAAATDTGHRGTGFDASWARGRPDLVADYAWRSIKVTSDTARDLLRRYYARPARRHYFMGCSFGGRQALVAASRWPAEWDGIIAGAPAVEWVEWLAAMTRTQRMLRHRPGAWIDADRIDALRHRRTAPSPAQRASLTALAHAGYPLASADPTEWRTWILNPDPMAPSQARLAIEANRYLFADRPTWTLADAERRQRPAAVRAIFRVGDLAPFLRRGGRVFAYVGTADAVLPAPKIAAAIVRRMRGASRARGYRLLTVPGMAHCQGGAVPDSFGQSRPAAAARDDAQHDIRRALEAWVERGAPPSGITLVRRRDHALRTLTLTH